MTYFDDVYPRFYDLICSSGSWFLWFVFFFTIGAIVAIVQNSESQYKKRILYFYSVSLVLSALIKLTLWVLLPSPEYLGLLK